MFALEWEFFPNNPQVGHLINILLYGLTGWLLFIVLLNLFGRDKIAFVFFATILFIAHPIHTEVVNNIKGRDGIVVFLFLLGSGFLERLLA